MRTHCKTHRIHATDVTEITDATCELAIAHDRYTVAFHVTTGQMWVIDSTGADKPRGPFLASRQAWAEAHELNHLNTGQRLPQRTAPAHRLDTKETDR